ncbi:uncharacterized protein BO87DRAFT_223329 [Aspergillus neoniger CBS 115656]|uniref:Uncharacterized protein n=1 Tax=Aspergillus neoniger (strain CBS 115656) TaxID=1448310 RepID=A0A318YR76_ASPNB|nr:hypothetical protein BO87DRAFT_223329 [Aspergillus neoniger CBS 115656]PYH37201.1 hypothetical protein BO87DRAFT_223329 [Aspergillus neoniger CBS 115656]
MTVPVHRAGWGCSLILYTEPHSTLHDRFGSPRHYTEGVDYPRCAALYTYLVQYVWLAEGHPLVNRQDMDPTSTKDFLRGVRKFLRNQSRRHVIKQIPFPKSYYIESDSTLAMKPLLAYQGTG